MAKIFSSNLHQNDNASIQFGAAIVDAVQNARQSMAYLANSRKADEYAPGAIHALRKLCEGEGVSLHINRIEVEEWREEFFAWFKRVKRWFPGELAEDFKTNAEEDFRKILECATNPTDTLWRREAERRCIQIGFKSEDDLEAARKIAEEKHPVQLGSALHKYLERCVAELVGEEVQTVPGVEPQSRPSCDSLCIRFRSHDGFYSLAVNEFDIFDAPEDLAQDIVTTAYDLEDAVQSYLKKNSPKTIKQVEFDCESSMFVVYANDAAALSKIVEAIITLAADLNLYATHREKE